MIKLSMLAGILAVAMGVAGMSLPNPAHAQSAAQDVCLARWVWNTDDGESPYWEPPFRANHLGTLNLRAISDKGPGPVSTGWGLFSYDAPMGSTGMHCMGGDLDAPMTTPEVNTIAVLVGIGQGQIRARDMRQVIRELLIDEADPTGVARWKPVQMTRKGLNISLAGYGQIYGESYSDSSTAFQQTLDVRIADYRRQLAAGVEVNQLRRQTGFDSFRLFGREPTSADLDRLLPAERRSDGYLCADISLCTTVNESFNTANADLLGPDLAWTEVSGDIDIVSNQAKWAGTTGYARGPALAGADMYAEGDTFNDVGGGGRGGSGCVRFDSGADTVYYVRPNSNGSSTFVAYDITERTAGTSAIIATSGATSDASGGVVRLEIIGSDLEVFYDGVTRMTTTDSSITGNTLPGLCGRHTGANRIRLDNFEAGDLGAVARRVIRMS